jgi:hypothetical protein
MPANDTGSAPVEFLAFGLPLFLVVLISSQVLIAGYLANVALDAASEGAQTLAYSDGTEQASGSRAAKVLNWLAPQSSYQVDSGRHSEAGITLALTSVRISSPFLLWAGQPILETAVVIDENN